MQKFRFVRLLRVLRILNNRASAGGGELFVDGDDEQTELREDVPIGTAVARGHAERRGLVRVHATVPAAEYAHAGKGRREMRCRQAITRTSPRSATRSRSSQKPDPAPKIYGRRWQWGMQGQTPIEFGSGRWTMMPGLVSTVLRDGFPQ